MKMFSSTYNRPHLIGLSIIILCTIICFPLSSSAQDKTKGDLSVFLEALNNYNSGNLEEARVQLHKITEEQKDNDAAPYYLAFVYLKKGEMEKAGEFMQKAIKRDSTNKWYKSRLADIYFRTGKTKEAEHLYNILRKQYPSQSELYDNLIDLYIRNKEYQNAITVLGDIEKSIGINEGTIVTRYNLLVFQGKEEEANEYLSQADKENSSPATSTLIADNYASMQKDSLAEQYYLKALTMAPDYIPANFGLAEIYRIQGKYDLYFKRMFSFMSDSNASPSMKKDYMEQMFANRRFIQTFLPQIDTIMQNMYSAHPSDSSIAYTYAIFLVQTENNKKAVDVLEKNLNNYPQARESHRQYLSLIYYLEDWEKLEEQSKKSLAIFPRDTDFMQFKGIAQMQKENLEQSIETFKNILQYAKQDSALLVNTLSTIADIYYQADNKKEAFSYYRKTIRKEPNHIPALNNYAYYLSLEGKSLKKALKMSRKTIEAEPENSTYLDTYGWILHLTGQHKEAKDILKKALRYGGKESADILDHYAEVLYTLGEQELAQIYWEQAHNADPTKGIDKKAQKKIQEIK